MHTRQGMTLHIDRGFRQSLEEAARPEWSHAMVNYQRFKQRLKYFARRRAQLRSLLKQELDGCLAESDIYDLVGPKCKFPARPLVLTDNDGGYELMNGGSGTSDYDSGMNSSVASSVGGDPYAAIKRRNERSVLRRVSITERNELLDFIQNELKKAAHFYTEEWKKLCAHVRTAGDSLDDEKLDGAFGHHPDLQSEMLELFAFCVMNIVATVQILIRYDAFARAYEGTPLMHYFMKKSVRKPTPFRQLLHHEELVALSNQYETTYDTSIHYASTRTMFDDILSIVLKQKSKQGANFVDETTYSLRRWFLEGLFEDRLGLEPAYLLSRGESLSEEMEKLVMWRQQNKVTASGPPPETKSLPPLQVFLLTLNLLSALLYCMNYYIVEPSSTLYVNRLGAHDAMSGTLIGMLPLAAFFSSIPYSYWTNRSFRSPFLFSIGALIVGNLVYSFADIVHDVRFALAGRFIAGLGAPKCIIRRYMADTTPVSLRTSVNAAFGMVVAAGSAMGPAMAILLNSVEYEFYKDEEDATPYVILDGLTLPGYFMAVLWLTFGIIVFMTFDEPNIREGLVEQQELEAASQCSQSSANNDDFMTVVSGDSALPAANLEYGDAPWHVKLKKFSDLITLPVRLCLFLLFCKVFTIESLVSATSTLSKNRYGWQVNQVGTLGLSMGLLVIPFSILIGRLSMNYQDHVLMKWLILAGCFGSFLLVDVSDLFGSTNAHYNEGHPLAVSPVRYILGYCISYISIQAFEGVIGSTLSKVIPTALALGTFNSGLLATLVDTFGRSCGDLFISLAGYISLRNLMNLLFGPSLLILVLCFILVQRCNDMLAV